MDIRISHTKTSRETIPATGFLGALGAPGTPAGEERVEVEAVDITSHVPLAHLLSASSDALINILQRDVGLPAEAEKSDEDAL